MTAENAGPNDESSDANPAKENSDTKASSSPAPKEQAENPTEPHSEPLASSDDEPDHPPPDPVQDAQEDQQEQSPDSVSEKALDSEADSTTATDPKIEEAEKASPIESPSDLAKSLILLTLVEKQAKELPSETVSHETIKALLANIALQKSERLGLDSYQSLVTWVGGPESVQSELCKQLNQSESDKIYSWSEQGLVVEHGELEDLGEEEELSCPSKAELVQEASVPDDLVVLEAVPKIKVKLAPKSEPSVPVEEVSPEPVLAAPRKVLKAKLVRRLADPVPAPTESPAPSPQELARPKAAPVRPVRARSARVAKAKDQAADANQFLQKTNIRWGLVIGALLLVGGSIPLALKLLQSENDLLKFITFVLTTLGLLALAETCVRCLKIKLTGQSLGGAYLFLVPLNLLAADALAIPITISGALGIVLSLGMLRAIPLLELRSLPLVVGGAVLSLAQLGPNSFGQGAALLWTLPVALIFAFSLTFEAMRLGKSEGEESVGGYFLSLAIPSFPFLLLIGRGMIGSYEPGQVALALFFAGFGLIQCGLAFTRRFAEDRRHILGSGLLSFGEILAVIGLGCAFGNPNLMLLMSACAVFSSVVAYRRDPKGRFLGLALIAGTLGASSVIALTQDWPRLLSGKALWPLYHSPIAWAYGFVALLLSKRKPEQATVVHIISILSALAFASELKQPGTFLCVAGLIHAGTVAISRAPHYSFAMAAFLGLGGIALTYEYDYQKLEHLALAGATIALGFRLIVGPARHFAASKAFCPGFTVFSAIFGIWALAASPLNGPASTLCLTASLLTVSALLGLFQKRNAFDAMFITACLVVLSLSFPALDKKAIDALKHPHAGLTMTITTALLSLVASGLALWREDWKKTVTLPMGIVSVLITGLAVPLQLLLDYNFSHEPEALYYGGATFGFSALTMLALSIQVRSRILSFLAGLQVIGAFALISSVVALDETAWLPVCSLALAFFFAEAPRLLARLGAPEEHLEPHRATWPALAFLAALPIDFVFLKSVLELLRGVEVGFDNVTIAFALVGLSLLYGLRVQDRRQGIFASLSSLHLYLAVTALTLLLPFDFKTNLGILAGLLPSVVLALSLLPKNISDDDQEDWKLLLQTGLSHVSTGLGALFLPIAFVVFVSGSSPAEINTGAAIGCLALGTYFSRLALSNWGGLFYCAYASYSLCMAFACVSITPERSAALGLGLGFSGALVQGLRLRFREQVEELLNALAQHIDICLLVSLPLAVLLTLVAPLHNLTPLALLLIGFAGVAGTRIALISIGSIAVSLAAFRGAALFYDGSSNFVEEVLGLSSISVTLAYLSAFAGRALGGRGESWDLRGKVLGNFGLIHGSLASFAIFAISMVMLNGRPGPETLGFFGGLFMLVALFAYWIYEAYQRNSEALVYFAEFSLASIFIFVRACKPEFFQTGLFKRFWPLIVVFISFLSVFLSSALNRLEKDIFGRAARRTGLFLPILALLGSHFFVGIGVSGLTFFVSAGLYGWVGAQRKSLPLSIVASWLFCIGLIDFTIYGNISFEFYPYLFAAPISLTFLATSILVRDKYPKEAKLLKDIGALILFSVLAWSLFADERGRVLESILLAVMSILGVILGIRLKERSLMILGTLFVLLDLISNIYWIGKEQAWVWWVSVMALGIAVILLFSYFERLQVLFEKNEEDSQELPKSPNEETTND